jgi:hypothetical protein
MRFGKIANALTLGNLQGDQSEYNYQIVRLL